MSLTVANVEIPVSPDHAFLYQGSMVSCKVFLLAGVPETIKTDLCNFFETVENEKLNSVIKDLLYAPTKNLSQTVWLNFCDFSTLLEPFNVKVAFAHPSFRMYDRAGEAKPSIEFCVLITLVEIVPMQSPDMDSAESCWNFNLMERVRETSEDI